MNVDDRLLTTKRALERDAARRQKPREHGGVLRAMTLIGSVGWPIALLTTGGALLGHVIDAQLGTGLTATLCFLTAGAVAGSAIAARSVLREGAISKTSSGGGG